MAYTILYNVYIHITIKQQISDKKLLECGPMPNVMVALPNIGGALCSTPQSLADAHYLTACSNAAKRESRLNLQGCLKLANRSQPLVGRSSPYCEDIWRTYCCSTSFSQCKYVPQLRRYSPTNLCDGAQMSHFGGFYGSCISSEPRAARFRPAS